MLLLAIYCGRPALVDSSGMRVYYRGKIRSARWALVNGVRLGATRTVDFKTFMPEKLREYDRNQNAPPRMVEIPIEEDPIHMYKEQYQAEDGTWLDRDF
jgi:hypothetical protein